VQGFVHTVVSFSVCEALINGFSTFMEYEFTPKVLCHSLFPWCVLLCPYTYSACYKGFSSSFVSWMGTVFIIACMVGSAFLGWVVDKYHVYKPMMILCLA
jgi:MFS family permease